MAAKRKHRADYVPAAPIARALRRWLKEHGLEEFNPVKSRNHENFVSPYTVLSDRLGLNPDTIYTQAYQARWENMQFDVADRLLAAVDQCSLWWQDPELAAVYEDACKAADKIRPIKAAA